MKSAKPKTELRTSPQLSKAVLGGKVAPLLFLVVFLLMGGALSVRGQFALDGFNPNVNGTVTVVMVQPDGKILIGGEFTMVSPEDRGVFARTNLARLNSDGSVDPGFAPNANGVVSAIAVQADGKILVGGGFTSIGGQARNRIARLNAATGAADPFNPDASGFGIPIPSVESIVVQPDGKILVGGKFSSIGGQARSHIARLDPTTGAADSFSPNASAGLGSSVQEIALQADGKILVGGGFTAIGGQTRNCVARLDPVTGVADSWNPNANNTVRAMALLPDGKVLIGGDFNVVGGVTTFLARLNPVTGAAEAFNPLANERVVSIAVQPDGKVVIGGFFTVISDLVRTRVARLDPVTGNVDGFNPNADFPVHVVAVQPDGKILVGGEFNNMGGLTRNHIARLETDGTLDRTLNISAGNDAVYATAIQPDGKILIGGDFFSVLGVTRNKMARLNRDGTLDTDFNPNANGMVSCIVVQTDGKILVGGRFTSIGGQARNYIARLDAKTGLADSFSPNANFFVNSIAVAAGGKVLAGGSFTSIGAEARPYFARLDGTSGLADSFNANVGAAVLSILVQVDGKILVGGGFNGPNSIGGQTRNYFARLDASTGFADSFNPSPNGAIRTIAVQTDGKILVGGDFDGTNSIGGQTRKYIARLDSATGSADSFNPSPDNIAYSMAVQSDGKVVVGGLFTQIGGQDRRCIARLEATTGLADSSFNPYVDVHRTVYSIALQSDGKILAGGTFFAMGGQLRSHFARLSNDTAALQNLAVTPATVSWITGGSTPQFSRVTFEFSTDNVNYTLLGNGTASGNTWMQTGLNLPIVTNIYLRARGYIHGGMYTGSEGIQESVRKVFLLPPLPILKIRRSSNTNVILSWATNFVGFTLESKTNLNTNVWNVVSPAPVVSGTNNVVTNAVSSTARFYRLRQ